LTVASSEKRVQRNFGRASPPDERRFLSHFSEDFQELYSGTFVVKHGQQRCWKFLPFYLSAAGFMELAFHVESAGAF
jgi:hypothetical protein